MTRPNIDIDDRLVKEGLKLTRLKTKKERINFALEELVRKVKRRKMVKFEGSEVWEGALVV
ncbi:MAG: transcriptional regulator of the Arc/MetJ class [Nitrospirae bacterium GWC2_57_13]|jgi:Arc/MetJ family transcription regulator|nr:MAG: transcriptional regulator of the Arc/MetJ class [Nitrospirae bacterium GWC1_57_7]OGW27240.1 MAG: transcriptional regulator of the Arc/MetJ class [Nitrospirae bacterium GWC2_57_13]OGW44561.1 MAG: transcriptional regulator of the Arc/MetJ class [Nitrospirae bacterium GWD2_57_8]HAR46169.1 DUF2191 domain-containing protein [Nitrospiraceae bacterium]HAS55035.1 DUF2191 domain-containing protein [Nitrospiraceae bacterium]